MSNPFDTEKLIKVADQLTNTAYKATKAATD